MQFLTTEGNSKVEMVKGARNKKKQIFCKEGLTGFSF